MAQAETREDSDQDYQKQKEPLENELNFLGEDGYAKLPDTKSGEGNLAYVIKGGEDDTIETGFIARVYVEDSTVIYETLSDECPIAGKAGDIENGGHNRHVLAGIEELGGKGSEPGNLAEFLAKYLDDIDFETDDYNPEEYPERIQLEEGTVFRYDGIIKIRRGTLGEDIHTRELGTSSDQRPGEFLEEAEEKGWGLEKIENRLEAPEQGQEEEPSGPGEDRKPETPSPPAGQRFGA